MELTRRLLLTVGAGVFGAGCTGTDGGTESPTKTGTDPPPTASATPDDGPPRCDPADVTRPPVATGGNIDGRPYPQKPSPLTSQSVLEYLADFETAFAWNRVLAEAAVTSLNIDTLDGFSPDETGDGFIASSGMRVTYTTEDGTTSEREYVANYFVSSGPVYRVESTTDPVTPTEQPETQLVQCGIDESSK